LTAVEKFIPTEEPSAPTPLIPELTIVSIIPPQLPPTSSDAQGPAKLRLKMQRVPATTLAPEALVGQSLMPSQLFQPGMVLPSWQRNGSRLQVSGLHCPCRAWAEMRALPHGPSAVLVRSDSGQMSWAWTNEVVSMPRAKACSARCDISTACAPPKSYARPPRDTGHSATRAMENGEWGWRKRTRNGVTSDQSNQPPYSQERAKSCYSSPSFLAERPATCDLRTLVHFMK
jgi:hypothetical protein